MDDLVLSFFNGGGHNKDYLSTISPQDMLPKEGFENINLSFYDKEDVSGNICRGLLYLDNFNGKSVICNLTTKVFKFLPAPKKSYPCMDIFYGSGLGYDSKSGDYKTIRNYSRCKCNLEDENDREGCRGGRHDSLLGRRRESDSWKKIPNPNAHISPECCVYIMGNCYWGAISDDDDSTCVLSFDFSDESFSSIPSPPVSEEKFFYDLVECDGFLGAIAYEYKIAKDSKRGDVKVGAKLSCQG